MFVARWQCCSHSWISCELWCIQQMYDANLYCPTRFVGYFWSPSSSHGVFCALSCAYSLLPSNSFSFQCITFSSRFNQEPRCFQLLTLLACFELTASFGNVFSHSMKISFLIRGTICVWWAHSLAQRMLWHRTSQNDSKSMKQIKNSGSGSEEDGGGEDRSGGEIYAWVWRREAKWVASAERNRGTIGRRSGSLEGLSACDMAFVYYFDFLNALYLPTQRKNSVWNFSIDYCRYDAHIDRIKKYNYNTRFNIFFVKYLHFWFWGVNNIADDANVRLDFCTTLSFLCMNFEFSIREIIEFKGLSAVRAEGRTRHVCVVQWCK